MISGIVSPWLVFALSDFTRTAVGVALGAIFDRLISSLTGSPMSVKLRA
jgi:hypothetical protein